MKYNVKYKSLHSYQTVHLLSVTAVLMYVEAVVKGVMSEPGR